MNSDSQTFLKTPSGIIPFPAYIPVTTFGEKAVDVFYVTDLTGQKILNANRRAAITRQLNAVLAPDYAPGGRAKKELQAAR